MSISRDEAREIAIVGLLVTIAFRVGAGVFQLIEELDGQWTVRSAFDRFFAPIGATIGMLTLGVVMVVVLSPTGSITPGLVRATKRAATAVAVLGASASFNTLALSYNSTLGKLWIAMINGLAAAILAGTAWWIIRDFDQDR